MSLFLSLTAFLLSVSAIVVGAEALRRINGQNEEFLKAYVQEIRIDLRQKDEQIAILRRDLAAVRANRSVSREALRALEKETVRKRQAVVNSTPTEDPGTFLPSFNTPKKRHIA